jgi:hypothetical protein
MTSSIWDENRQILFSIIQEQMSENNVSDHQKNDILDFSQHIISVYHKKRFSYPNVVEMNKAILSDISQYIYKQKKNDDSQHSSQVPTFFGKKPIQDIPLHKIQPDDDTQFKIEDASIQKLHQERLDTFSRDVSKKEAEFQQSMKTVPPNDIDFRDPDQDETFDIDRLLEQEMKKRQLEIVPVANAGNIDNNRDRVGTRNKDTNEFDMDNNAMKMNVKNEVSEFIKEPPFSRNNSTDHRLSSPNSSTVISFQENVYSNEQNYIDVQDADYTSDDNNTGILNRLKTVNTNSNIERNIKHNETTHTKPLKSILKKPNNKTEMYRSYYIYKTQLYVTNDTNANAIVVAINDPSIRNFSQSKHIMIESIILLHYPIIPVTPSDKKPIPPIPIVLENNENKSNSDARLFLPSTTQPFLFSGEFCLPTSNTFKVRSLNNDILSFDEICIQYRLV